MKHSMKIMIPFLMIAGLLTGCGSQVTTGSKAETTQASKTKTTTAVSEQETQTETEQTPEAADAVTEAPEETTDETADSNILAWLICKMPYIVPIPGTRKLGRLTENLGAADVVLTAQEVAEIDKALIDMEMSDVFGGAKIVKK